MLYACDLNQDSQQPPSLSSVLFGNYLTFNHCLKNPQMALQRYQQIHELKTSSLQPVLCLITTCALLQCVFKENILLESEFGIDIT